MIKIDRIIIEGADQQGKSTFAKKVSELLGWPIQHFAKPDDDFNFFDDYLVENKTISDRNFISEIVYSNFRGSNHRVERVKELEVEMRKQNYLVILLDRGYEFEYEDRDEDFTKEEILKSMQLYDRVFRNISLNRIRLNAFSDDQVETVLNVLRNACI